MVDRGGVVRVIICGGRDFDNVIWMRERLEDFHHRVGNITTVIHGGASGADAFAGAWARNRGIDVEVFRAEWAKDGKAAGPIRNQRMLAREPEAVIAFPGGRGTADMVRRAKAAGVRVVEMAADDRSVER